VSEGHDPASGTLAPASDGRREPDVLSGVLRTVRLTGALFFNVKASSPWVAESLPAPELAPIILPRAQHVVSYHVVTDGHCWAEVAGEAPVQLQAGDVVVVPHGDAYALSSRPGMLGQIPRPEIDGWFRQMMAGGLPLDLTEGEGPRQDRRVMCGFLGCDVRPFNPVLAALPRLLHVPASRDPGAQRLGHLIEFAQAEVTEPRAGRDCVLLRISELMFVEVVRRHLAALPPGQMGWLRDCATRRWARPSRCCTASPPGTGRWKSWPAGPACRARRSPSASPSWWGSRPCSTWRAGACRSPPACWPATIARSRPWPSRSVTNRKPPSAAPSRRWWAALPSAGKIGARPPDPPGVGHRLGDERSAVIAGKETR
jgi:hypothetical protein